MDQDSPIVHQRPPQVNQDTPIVHPRLDAHWRMQPPVASAEVFSMFVHISLLVEAELPRAPSSSSLPDLRNESFLLVEAPLDPHPLA